MLNLLGNTPLLARFFQLDTQILANGMISFEYSKNRLLRKFFEIFRFPIESKMYSTELKIKRINGKGVWVRKFGPYSIKTFEVIYDEHIVEYFSLGKLNSQTQYWIKNIRNGIRYHSRQIWLIGLPIPKLITPEITADIMDFKSHWTIEVSIRIPLIGKLIRYGGQMRLNEY